MPMFKTCTACKETFIAESPFIKLCPICNAKSQTTPAERAQRKTRITPDRLMLDVRQADAAGKSYLEPGCRCITDGHEAAGSTGRVQH